MVNFSITPAGAGGAPVRVCARLWARGQRRFKDGSRLRGRAGEPRRDGQWVLHGHTITDMPQMQAGRIAIDTGAYATGRLTAALVLPGMAEPRFITT